MGIRKDYDKLFLIDCNLCDHFDVLYCCQELILQLEYESYCRDSWV
jgi:hypothetical protein